MYIHRFASYEMQIAFQLKVFNANQIIQFDCHTKTHDRIQNKQID